MSNINFAEMMFLGEDSNKKEEKNQSLNNTRSIKRKINIFKLPLHNWMCRGEWYNLIMMSS